MILLKNIIVVDAGSKHHLKKRDILIKNGKISEISTVIKNTTAKVIEKKGLHVSIGWMDSSVCIGEPGFEERETLINGLHTAAHSGFTTIMMNPNNHPNPQDHSGISYLKNCTSADAVTVLPVGNFTVNQEGVHLAELYDMQQAGAVSFYDFKKSIDNANLLKVGLQYVKSFNGIIQSYPQQKDLAGKGMVNEDIQTTHLGLKTMPSIAEDVQIARDLQIASYTGARLHIPSVSTQESISLIKEAKKKNKNITCSTSIHNLALDSSVLVEFDTRYKLQPPLRDTRHVNAVKKGLKDGTIDTVTSDHIPLNIEYKAVEFDQATYGSIGLESAFGIINPILGLEKTIEVLTSSYQVFDQEKPEIKEDQLANLSLFVPNETYTLETKHLTSTSKNCAYLGMKHTGKAYGIINNKKVIWNG